MSRRRGERSILNSTRAATLRHTLKNGAAWETPISDRLSQVFAVKTNKKKPTRVGAKAAKNLERLESEGYELNEAESTNFRALAARANYLALDRPDMAYATKELCR